MRMVHFLSVAAAAGLLVGGCAGAPRESEAAKLARYQSFAGEAVSSISYTSTSSAGFTVVDDEHVLLTTRPRGAYLLRLSGPCLAFERGSPSLTVTSNLGRIQSRLDTVGSLHEPNMTCIIQEIRPVDVHAMREAEKSGNGAG